MINLYNYVIFIISRHISNLFFQKKVGVFDFLINLSIGNFKFSKYGIKLVNRDIKENTYRFCLGAAYGESYSNYIVKIDVEGLEKIVINELLNSNISKLISSIFVEIDSRKNFYIINKMLKKKNFKIIKNFKTNLTKYYLFIKK